jgi:hypothetical protein
VSIVREELVVLRLRDEDRFLASYKKGVEILVDHIRWDKASAPAQARISGQTTTPYRGHYSLTGTVWMSLEMLPERVRVALQGD